MTDLDGHMLEHVPEPTPAQNLHAIRCV
jgi:hypothetical protein